MAIRTRTIRSLSGLLTALAKDTRQSAGPVWYRGHAKANWKLLSGYHRLKKPPPEGVLINNFRQNANLLLAAQPRSDFDWLFIMQHYGVPTRLLDWTESPLAGVYFAATTAPTSDGALWLLFPLRLNVHAVSTPEQARYVPSFNDEEMLGNYSTLNVDKGTSRGLSPLAVLATRNNDRIRAQLGVFTIGHVDRKPIEDVADGTHLVKYVIPSTSKARLRRELRTLAFTKFQLFPELVSIADQIRGDLA